MFNMLWVKADGLEKSGMGQKGDGGARATTLSRTTQEKRIPPDHCPQLTKPKHEM